MEIAVLDLGSTTFHLQHICIDAESRFSTTLDEKRSICLGAQVFAHGFVDRQSWLTSLNAVWELLEASRARKPDHVLLVATSAIRSASNGAALVSEIERRQGIGVRVLAPEQEARLAYLGQSTSPVVSGRRVAAIDLGGGSVEVAVGEGARCIHAASLPIGAVRMKATDGAETARDFGAEEARQLCAIVRARSGDALRKVKDLSPEIVVFGSGSARAARKLLMRHSSLAGKVGPIETAAFRSLLEHLLGLPASALIPMGVEPARASTVLVAATIMVQLLELLDVDAAYVSDKGLRDGVALELYRELRAAGPERSHRFDDVTCLAGRAARLSVNRT
jgi:exopolyphosphatase/guanosine-5'-triphosphate,3'-diphosphate pyrophosphatase